MNKIFKIVNGKAVSELAKNGKLIRKSLLALAVGICSMQASADNVADAIGVSAPWGVNYTFSAGMDSENGWFVPHKPLRDNIPFTPFNENGLINGDFMNILGIVYDISAYELSNYKGDTPDEMNQINEKNEKILEDVGNLSKQKPVFENGTMSAKEIIGKQVEFYQDYKNKVNNKILELVNNYEQGAVLFDNHLKQKYQLTEGTLPSKNDIFTIATAKANGDNFETIVQNHPEFEKYRHLQDINPDFALEYANLYNLQDLVPELKKQYKLKDDIDYVLKRDLNLGSNRNITGEGNISMGDNITINNEGNDENDNNIVFGNNVNIGNDNNISTDKNISIGNDVSIEGYNNIVLGNNNHLTNASGQKVTKETIVIGNDVTVNPVTHYGTVIGQGATINALSGVVIGHDAMDSGTDNTVAIGHEATTYSNKGVSIGFQSKSKASATALGSKAQAMGTSSISIGDRTKATGDYATSIGPASNATAQSAIALGIQASSTAMNAVAIGGLAKATHQDGVAIGSFSQTKDLVSVENGTVDDLTITDFAGNNRDGKSAVESVVSIGNVAGGVEYTRQIVHVAPGEISETSTDAINGSQLFATAKALNTKFNGKANVSGDNLTNINAWQTNLQIGTGTIGGDKDSQSVSGETVKNYIADQNFITEGDITKGDLKGGNEIEVTGEGKLLDANLTLSLKDGSISQSKLDKDLSDKINSKVDLSDLDGKANVAGDNLTNINTWQTNLQIGTGTMGGDSDNQSVTGETVINYLEDNYYSKGDIDKIIDNIDTGNGGNGVDKEYVDNADKETLEKANDYTDNAKNEAVKEANEHSDANDIITLEKANEYTDEKFKGIDGEQIRTNTNNIERIEGIVKDNSYRIDQNAKAIQENSRRIDNLDDKYSNAMAASNALGGLPQAMTPGKTMFTAGLGNYDNKQALAVGYSTISENKKHIIKIGVATNFSGDKKLSASVSYGYEF